MQHYNVSSGCLKDRPLRHLGGTYDRSSAAQITGSKKGSCTYQSPTYQQMPRARDYYLRNIVEELRTQEQAKIRLWEINTLKSSPLYRGMGNKEIHRPGKGTYLGKS